MSKLTPAGEALEKLREFFSDAKCPPFENAENVIWDNTNTIRTALEMLDRVQRGDTKELRREPTREMWAASGDAQHKRYGNVGFNFHHDVVTECVWSAAWDAAALRPATENTVEGEKG